MALLRAGSGTMRNQYRAQCVLCLAAELGTRHFLQDVSRRGAAFWLRGETTMNKLAVATAPPARLLLATDFSARSDRALERAAQLAHEWQAEMIALNVLEHIVFPDQVLTWMDGGSDEQALEIATRQMVRDLEGLDVSAKCASRIRATPPKAFAMSPPAPIAGSSS